MAFKKKCKFRLRVFILVTEIRKRLAVYISVECKRKIFMLYTVDRESCNDSW